MEGTLVTKDGNTNVVTGETDNKLDLAATHRDRVQDFIPDEYIPSNKHKINNVIGFKSSKPKQLQTLAVMAYLRKKVYDRKVELTQETSYHLRKHVPLSGAGGAASCSRATLCY